jgi:uncharacterized protein (TIGR00251 family)
MLCSMPGDLKMAETVLKVYLQPRSSRDEIVGPYRDGIKVKVTAPPAEGKANEALIRFFARELGISPSSIEILKGHRFREKTLRISHCEPLDFKKKIH